MSNMACDQTVFLMLVKTARQRACTRLLIDSIRSFGGPLSHCPVWLFEADPLRVPCRDLKKEGLRVLPLAVPDNLKDYWFAGKVYACARAEELAAPDVQSLIWTSPDCLVINPPSLFDLAASTDAAVRPVHIRNIGLRTEEPLDDFWKKIYETVGVEDIEATVESFVDQECIRAYFNSHAFSVNPSKGLLRRWLECFDSLVCDQQFQSRSCRDNRHQIFLHQAVLSALIVTLLAPQRIRVLPPEYNYPYNLHQSVPSDRRAPALNDLVSIAYEDRDLDPSVMRDISVKDPLRSWLSARCTSSDI